MTELLVGTKKGLFRLEGDAGDGGFEVTARAFAGQSVEYAMRDPRTGRYLASVTSWFYGPRIWVTDDPAGEWEQAEGTALPEGDEQALERIWVIVPGEADGVLYAGGDPGTALREPRRRAHLERSIAALWDHPTRPDWSPGAGGLCLHTIAPWPGDPSRLLVAISAVGVWLSDDGGETLAPLEHGHRARVPPRGRARQPDPALRPRRPPLARTARAALHAVPRRRLPLRRRGRELDRRRRGPALRLRLPGRRRPGGSRQRLRDPADRRGGPDDARGAACGSGRRATRARPGRRAATACPRRTPT